MGCQDYTGYFPDRQHEFKMGPRVNSEAIKKLNSDLIQQALKTRHLKAIPKHKIKTKKVKAQALRKIPLKPIADV